MTKSSSFNEPTLRDVIDIMETRFTAVDERLDSLNTRVDGIDERLIGVEHRLGNIEVTVLEMQEEIRGSLAATDHNSVQLLDHEKRIRKLEKARR